MDDDLITRLRGYAACMDIDAYASCDEAADTLEAQARRIAELEKNRDGWMAEAQKQIREVFKQAARIAELEAENAKFRAMYDEQLLMAVKVSAALEKKND